MQYTINCKVILTKPKCTKRTKEIIYKANKLKLLLRFDPEMYVCSFIAVGKYESTLWNFELFNAICL